MTRFEGKTVVITGGSRGIGAALLEHYHDIGKAAFGTARTPSGELLPLDVTVAQSHQALARRLNGLPVDLLVCNAGVYPDKGQTLATGYRTALWSQAFATNVTGVFLTIQSLLPNLRAVNFVIEGILGKGVAHQARFDPQAKGLGEWLRSRHVDLPEAFLS